tara:strand:+ start:1243 stop:2598 length:1356 start_codon:yes stop_codon:yes gene_type:complete
MDNNEEVTLFSRNGAEKIVCHKFMERFFKDEGYISSNKLYINLLHTLLNFKILRKIKAFCALFLRCKFFFNDPKHVEFVIFDSEHSFFIEKILPNKNYVIISTRIEQIKEINMSKKVIFYIIKNLFKRSLKQNYLTALIKVIAPSVVITHISDSKDFHIISSLLSKKIQFIAIQTYTTAAFNNMFQGEDKKNFFIPNFFCYGEYDKLFYQKQKVNIKNFEAIGSLNSSLSYEYTRSKKIKIDPNKYDICLISEPMAIIKPSDYPQIKNLQDCWGQVAEFTHRICKKHNLNMVFSGKYAKNTTEAKKEIFFYKHYLKNYNFEIFQSSEEIRKYSSYINMMQSKLTISLFSTMLREAISFDKKFLSFNTVGHPDVEFPGPDIPFPQQSICVLKESSYELFEERVLKILSMTNEEFYNQLGVQKSFIMKPTIDSANIMRERIKEIADQENKNKP